MIRIGNRNAFVTTTQEAIVPLRVVMGGLGTAATAEGEEKPQERCFATALNAFS